MMNFDAMSRAGAAGRIALTEAAAVAMGGVPAGELVVREFDDYASEIEEVDGRFGGRRQERQGQPRPFTPDELKAIKLKTADQYNHDRRFGSAASTIPSKTNGTAKYGHRRHAAAGHGVWRGRPRPPVRYGATVKSVRRTVRQRRCRASSRAVTLDDKTGTTTGWVVAVANTYTNGPWASRGCA